MVQEQMIGIEKKVSNTHPKLHGISHMWSIKPKENTTTYRKTFERLY